MTVLSVEHLHFAYQDKVVLDDLTFSLPKGRLIGIVGPNGSGRTTWLKLLARQLPLQRGEIHVHGQSLQAAGSDGFRHIVRGERGIPGGSRPLQGGAGDAIAWQRGVGRVRRAGEQAVGRPAPQGA